MRQIYIHGLGQTSDSWQKTILRLKASEYSICPDLAELVRGEAVTYKNLYAAFSTAYGKLNESVDLCGLSLGGVLALNYAAEYPQRVRSLVLIAAQYKMPKGLLRLQNALFKLMPRSMFRQTGFGKADFLQLCGSMMELDFSSSLQKISCPVLVLCGEKDTANKKASMELAESLGHAEFQVIEGAGHEVNVEAPEKLAEALQAFYSRKA